MLCPHVLARSVRRCRPRTCPTHPTAPGRSASRSAPGVDIALVRNDDHWATLPSIGQVTFEFRRLDLPRRLQSGRFDLVTTHRRSTNARRPTAVWPGISDHPRRRRRITADPGALRSTRRRRRGDRPEHLRRVRRARRRPVAVARSRLQRRLEPLVRLDEAMRLLEEAGVAGATITLVGDRAGWLNDQILLEAVAGYWQAVGLTAADILEFGVTRRALRPREPRRRRSTCRVRTTRFDLDCQFRLISITPPVASSCRTATLTSLPRSKRAAELTPTPARIYEEAVQIAYDEASLPSGQQRGYLRPGAQPAVDAAGRLAAVIR